MTNIKIFEDKKIRTAWNADSEEWLFSVVDVIAVLTDSPRPRKYWNALKTKLAQEGSELSHNVGQLKMTAEDGKKRETDILDTKGILRLIQSVPSKKAEPFKMWLAEVGNDRLNEIADPEKAIMRGAEFYRKKGYPEGWINQRLQTIEMRILQRSFPRKELTDEWQRRGITQEKQDVA
jgi:prophage antirepressor-like protein